MTRILAYDSRIRLINEQLVSAYKDESSFFAAYIDPYYYLNLVDLNNQLKYDEELEDTLAGFTIDLTGNKSYAVEDGNVGEGKLYLTNLQKNHTNTDKFITAYSLQNNAADVTQDNGYSRTVQYYDYNTREYLQFQVEPITSENLPEGLAPLKGRSDEERYLQEKKYLYAGKQSANVHENFLYAQVHNYQNVSELEKLFLTVVLEKANMSLYRFQRIPIIIYDNSVKQTSTKKIKEQKTDYDRDWETF